MTDYSELEKSRKIRPGKFSNKQIFDCLALSKRDLQIAEKILKENQDWSFNIAYNAMLQASKALMYSKGFRPTGIGLHATIIEFAGIVLGDKYTEIIEVLDTMRRKRNTAIYDIAGLISSKEATEAIKTAKYLVKEIIKILD